MHQIISNSTANRSFFYVQVHNGGGYVASFSVSYYLNGIFYKLNSGMMALGYIVKIKIPKIATNPHVEVLVWFLGDSKPIYTSDLTVKKRLCLFTYGTIFYPVCVKVPCNPYSL